RSTRLHNSTISRIEVSATAGTDPNSSSSAPAETQRPTRIPPRFRCHRARFTAHDSNNGTARSNTSFLQQSMAARRAAQSGTGRHRVQLAAQQPRQILRLRGLSAFLSIRTPGGVLGSAGAVLDAAGVASDGTTLLTWRCFGPRALSPANG